uniref:Uncharacterized protein n=1 Tax=Megaselia scalaris TaxID=36166 RepID=T1H2C7_MEGSC
MIGVNICTYHGISTSETPCMMCATKHMIFEHFAICDVVQALLSYRFLVDVLLYHFRFLVYNNLYHIKSKDGRHFREQNREFLNDLSSLLKYRH